MADSLTTDGKRPDTSKADEALLQEIRERFDVAQNFWKDIRAEGATDMRYVAGDPWDSKDRTAREQAGRPCLSLDELGQYFNQVINDVRANPRGMKFAPTGNGANDKGALFYQDKAREIEYRSHAQVAYTTAFENAVQRSYGWCQLVTKMRPKSFDQEIFIKDVPNPDLILPDPDATEPDSSDMKYLFKYETWKINEFKRTYKNAAIVNFGEYRDAAPAWIKDQEIILAEYWRVEPKKKRLLRIQSPDRTSFADFYEDELKAMPPGGIVIAEREEDVPSVVQYLTNGVEILKKTPWAGKYIPFASCFGKRIYVDEGSGPKLKILSMTRLARDPYMLYCYYRTAQAELVGMTPKTPFVGYVGQFRTRTEDWQKVHHQPIAFIEADPVTDGTGGQILPLPQRQPYDPPIERLELGAEGARRAIQAAMGQSPLPSAAQRRNEKSGVALKEIDRAAAKGSYHFIDHYDDMIRHVGVMIEDLLPKIHDNAQNVGIRKPDDKAEIVRINDPQDPEAISTQGDYQVTVSTGPAVDSEREAGSEFADLMVQNIGTIAQVAGPPSAAAIMAKAVRLKNLGAIGDQLAELIEPPTLKNPDGSKPDAAQLEKLLQQAQGQMQQMQQALQQQQQVIATDQVKAERDVALNAQKQQSEDQREQARLQAEQQVKIAELASKERLENRKLEVQLEIEMAKLGSAQMMKRGELEAEQLHQHGEHLMRQQELGAAQAQSDMDRQNERDVKTAELGLKAREGDEGRKLQREEGAESRAFEADQAERARQQERERPEA